MKEKNKHKEAHKDSELDTELLRMYMMGATHPKFSDKNQTFQTRNSGSVNKNQFENADDVVDLHLEGFAPGNKKIHEGEALLIQLEKFEKALDSAVAGSKLELRVIHGLGKGKLRAEIYKILDKSIHVRSYEKDVYHSKYGYGSTLILLK